MLYSEIIAVCSQIHTKHINTLCGQNVQLLNVKVVVHIVTTGLYIMTTGIQGINYNATGIHRRVRVSSQGKWNSDHAVWTVQTLHRADTAQCRHCTVTVQTVHVAYIERTFASDVLHQAIYGFILSTVTYTLPVQHCGMCLSVINISNRRQCLRNGCSVFSMTFHCKWPLNL